MTQFEQLKRDAQATANRTGRPMAIFNLNKVGRALCVIRESDSFPGENCLIAGPFEPNA